ncbi:kinesin-like protein KIF12 isoform X2 [Venturia canescens]|uniref:kinesin-like protein KIF12 isoform X2 n=2 Tax=Venturia canescens TaxID=32260 RepID=UPI001C9BEE7F|nr:kinesin-like protein KIF12 isoform X2 [Venturia canescens]
MVLLKSPSPKRGGSPQRDAVGAKSTGQERRERIHRRSRGNSPSERSNGSRGSSPGKSSAGSKEKSPSLAASRGSEIGSIERLADGDKRVIASQRLLPEDNINVVVRVRPLSIKEKKSGESSAVHFPGSGQIHCEGPSNSGDKKAKLFSYNVVFEPAASQEDVLQFSGIKKLIEMAVEGFSTTAFCYGQTGSGKTHTLTGPPGLFENGNPYSEDHGLVFRSFVYLFRVLQERKECHFILKASFLEIYNEKVIDLLNPGSSRKPLAVRWSKKIRGFFVENLFTVECEELDDLLAVLEEGMRNRSVGTHNMNEHSSRSHTILTVHITSEQQMENGVFISKQGKINFVDLAGSEMTKKTQSEGKTLEEANNINKSLMVLGYCIASLSDGKKKGGHIPYRDSKLTKLLADSLAGNGVTLMIACVSPARSNSSETLNTLRYAARAKKIRTKPIVVMDPREALILSLKREVTALQTENDHLRSALHLGNESSGLKRSDSKAGERRVPMTPPPVDLDKLAELESGELSQLLRAYITENEALRRENAELYATREQVMRDQELVCRENERLLKKLEDVNSVCCRSPIIPARPTYSAEMLHASLDDVPGATNIWTNPNADTNSTPTFTTSNEGKNNEQSSTSGNIPDKLLKELDKRIVGSFSNIAETYRDKISHHRRHNSWDNGRGSGSSPDQTYSPVETNQSRKSPFRRTSTVPEEISSSSVADVLGVPVLPLQNSPNGTPDSLLSGPLVDGQGSAPDTGDSINPTIPFPPISRSSSPFVSLADHESKSNGLDSGQKLRRSRRRAMDNGHEDLSAQRAFGSPVSLDGDHF